MTKPSLHMIGGPTASGKTAAALDLARRVNGAIINADAMQVYRGLPLLTAQPLAQEKAEIPHHLFEIFDPSERSSAGRWLALAKRTIAETVEAGQTPILVGGTGMYFAALLGGLAEIPAIPDEVRAHATEIYDTQGHEAFRIELAKIDPDSAAKIMPNDRQRLIRAYEVAFHTGKTLGQWQKEGEAQSIEADFTIHRQCLMPDRAVLYARCDARFLKMIEGGALDEVRGFLDHFQGLTFQQGSDSQPKNQSPLRHSGETFSSSPLCGERKFNPESGLVCDAEEKKPDSGSSRRASGASLVRNDGVSLPSMKILGVPELAAHLRGDLSLDDAISKAQQSTRNYAKRQCTWFRNQWSET